MAGHVAPEAVHGGPIAAVADGDEITIDVDARRLDVALSDEEIASRAQAYTPPPNPDATGVLAKYAAFVSSASQGAVTNPAAPRPAPPPAADREAGPVIAPEA
jgi:dihydroxy-acid dehydratase